MSQKLGIKESLEMVRFAEQVIEELAKHKMDDGKITVEEIVQTLSTTASSGVKAIWGSWQIGKELADLTEEERKTLLDETFPVILKLVGVIVNK